MVPVALGRTKLLTDARTLLTSAAHLLNTESGQFSQKADSQVLRCPWRLSWNFTSGNIRAEPWELGVIRFADVCLQSFFACALGIVLRNFDGTETLRISR